MIGGDPRIVLAKYEEVEVYEVRNKEVMKFHSINELIKVCS